MKNKNWRRKKKKSKHQEQTIAHPSLSCPSITLFDHELPGVTGNLA